jgi:WD40 repeat protein
MLILKEGDEGEVEFVVSSYVHHEGAVTTMCAGPASAGSPTPTFLFAGSSTGCLSFYPVSPPEEAGSYPVVGVPGSTSTQQQGSHSDDTIYGAAFQGSFNHLQRKWEHNNDNLSIQSISPMAKVATTLDGENVCCLKENGLLTVHSVKSFSNSDGGGHQHMQVDPIIAFDACWRNDGSQVLTVGAQQLKLWDIGSRANLNMSSRTGGGGGGGFVSKPCMQIGDGAESVPFTSVCCAQDDMFRVAVGTAAGDILIYDLRMNSSSSSALHTIPSSLSRREAHTKGCMIRQLQFHPRNSNMIMSGGDDGLCILTDLSSISSNNNNNEYDDAHVLLARAAGFNNHGNSNDNNFFVPSSCVAMCYEPETNYFAAAFDNETLSVRSRFPYLDRMSRLM